MKRVTVVAGIAVMCTLAAMGADLTYQAPPPLGGSTPIDDNATVQLPPAGDGWYSWDGDEWIWTPSK